MHIFNIYHRVYGIFTTSKYTSAVLLAILFYNCEFGEKDIANCTPHIEIDKNTPTFLHFLPKTQRLHFC